MISLANQQRVPSAGRAQGDAQRPATPLRGRGAKPGEHTGHLAKSSAFCNKTLILG